LPDNYKQLVEFHGAGSLVDFLKLLVPNHGNEEVGLLTQVERHLRALRELER
jgi:hypothetical protein